MKRTVEIVLTVIGILLYAFPIVVGWVFVAFQDNPQVREEFIIAMNEASGGQEFTNMDINQVWDMMGTFAMFILISSIVGVVLGILSIFFLSKNRRPKTAGIILILTAVVLTFATVGLGLFSGGLYLIAGIVALVRKTPRPVQEDTTVESY
ncbi:DUF4064 domain-containing protein [Halobacillus fulvus]|nr:DUF4064 domain-containing protein [Halobacillus fulvus]